MGKGKRMREQRRQQLLTSPRQDPQQSWTTDSAPAEAVEAYAEVLQWAADHPDAATEVATADDEMLLSWQVGIVNRQRLNFPAEQVRNTAWMLRANAILNGDMYMFDWNTPIALMSDEEIIAALDADGRAGKLPEMIPDGS